MPVDIYAALGALVRAEATRDHERRVAAAAAAAAAASASDPAPGDAPDGPRTADAGAPEPHEDRGVNDN
ncbi:hypothetical protein ACFWVC_13155 [Streptomyces sp. NPDC058691]|uniref:hypothetical protein n=1 Tax=Streptomyces sp. NPDC058691 TaxID=3346601 RepID=UPI003662982E